MECYGYLQQKITNLCSIDNNSNKYYNYKGLHFLSKMKNNNKNLVVIFHGAIPDFEERSCCFRGFNYEIENTDIICVSDILLGIYKNFQISWYLSSSKHNINAIYIEFFDYFINNKAYDKIIFTGTSGGGYPSLYFSSLYKKTALIANSQIYPEHYWHYNDLIKKLNENDDKLLYENKNIETTILKQQPEKIILYQNLNDDSLNFISNAYYEPFVDFIKENQIEQILDLHLFHGTDPPQGKTQHHVFFPEKETHLSILKTILK
jgi:predicted esterase YcpF (UPF0227 family)